MTEPNDDGLVSLSCDQDGCDYETGLLPPAGQGSAAMRIGQHRYNKHNIRGAGRKPKPGTPSREDLRDRPALTIVASGAQAARGGTGKPTAEKLTEGLGEMLALSTIGMASFLAETDPHIAPGPDGENQRDQVVAYLTLPLDTAKDVMRPLASAVAPTKLNAKYGRAVVNNAAAIGSFIALGQLFMHYRFYLRERSSSPQPLLAGASGAAPVIADVGAAVPQSAHASPGVPSGIIVTPDMVDQIRRNRGA